MRDSWNEYFLNLCDVIATRATCNRGPHLHCDPVRRGVGCVIVSTDHRILATGYNGSPHNQPHCEEVICYACGYREAATDTTPCMDGTECPSCHVNSLYGGHILVDNHCIRAAHAEANAIADAARRGIRLDGALLYCNTQPCWNCGRLAYSAGLSQIYYEHAYSPDPLVEKLWKERIIHINGKES